MNTTTTSTDVLGGPAEPLLALVLPVLDDLAEALDAIGAEDLARPTPCERYDVAALRDHVVGWLDFFAAALADPEAAAPRPDPEAYSAAAAEEPASATVRAAAAGIARSVCGGVHQLDAVQLSQAAMPGPAVMGMLMGEYLLHGWDLRAALGLPRVPDATACDVARVFFEGMILPEYRGGDQGYFGDVVPVPQDAPSPDRLLGFAGRDPNWSPAGHPG